MRIAVRIGLLALCVLFAAGAAATTPALDAAATKMRLVAGDHRMILVGEMHGTREVPQLMAALVDGYAQDGPVLLGLELPRSGQAALRTYLDSDGSARARDALRAQPFLKPPNGRNDGRRNEDVLDLVEHVRALRAAGRDVSILPFDVVASRDGAQARDRDMSDYLRRAYRALPAGRLLVVSGNVHAMHVRPDVPDAAKFQMPMGHYLADLLPYSVDVSAAAGSFWACMPACGPQPAHALSDTSGAARGPFRDSFDYLIVLPRFTPARVL